MGHGDEGAARVDTYWGYHMGCQCYDHSMFNMKPLRDHPQMSTFS